MVTTITIKYYIREIVLLFQVHCDILQPIIFHYKDYQ